MIIHKAGGEFMKRLFMVFLLIASVFTISACTEGDDFTGNLLKQSLTANSKESESVGLGSTGKNEEAEEDTKAGWLERVKATLQRTQRTKTYASSPSFAGDASPSIRGEDSGEWILLRNGTDMHCLDADYNGDLMVTLPDFGMFATYYTHKEIEADLNFDGNVSLSDFGIFGSYYNNCDYTGNETNTTTEYEYEIEIDDSYTINGTLDTGVIVFNAWGQPDTGFVVDGIETSRVLAEFPRELGYEWGPLYYQDTDGDYQQAQNVSTFYVWRPSEDYDRRAEVDYIPSTGNIELDGHLLGDDRIWIDWSNLTHIVSFEYFGQYAEMAEFQELYITILGAGYCGGNGYYGKCEQDVNVGDHMVIRNPKENFDNDEFRFSIYL